MTKTTEQIVASGKAAGVTVTVTQRPKGSGGEVVPLPGVNDADESVE